ncbi:hypothetical protein [Chelativorans salis]|uniref:Uncharacterized protein n=1 Tax=Chelativorans salis TaxID=2978478 RepID=A0ABT2LUL9_9HYPH|nr:hypothetical protein [Chelativorans sp. EGI FJ00035]MCT7378225.1 hypothetical protein [Chelativorans sp. EGI FJ00035]
MADPTPDTNGGMPLWVKVQGVFVVLLVLIVVGMFSGVVNELLGSGGHGMPVAGH